MGRAGVCGARTVLGQPRAVGGPQAGWPGGSLRSPAGTGPSHLRVVLAHVPLGRGHRLPEPGSMCRSDGAAGCLQDVGEWRAQAQSVASPSLQGTATPARRPRTRLRTRRSGFTAGLCTPAMSCCFPLLVPGQMPPVGVSPASPASAELLHGVECVLPCTQVFADGLEARTMPVTTLRVSEIPVIPRLFLISPAANRVITKFYVTCDTCGLPWSSHSVVHGEKHRNRYVEIRAGL